jgi:DNA-binding winged helix-turn-helix (wHTH) protein/TolB-like protein
VTHPRTTSFGVFEFDRETGELRRSGRVVALEPQPARALGLLLANAGELVSREQLRAAIWEEGTHVDFDRGLAYVISQIRTALGDSADNPRFVQTVPRRGYRFIAPVMAAADVPASVTKGIAPVTAASEPTIQRARGPWQWIGVAGLIFLAGVMALMASRNQPHGRAVVAVSAFDNETGDPEHDRRVAALSDAVVVQLTQLDPARIAVIGNAEVLRRPRNIRNLKTLQTELDADYVLLGQLQRSDQGLRFITHFIRLDDEAHLRANRLSFADGDLSGLENAVVAEFERAVAEHLR